ncbi:MAG: hypothetical protein GY938_24410 [Ketobacter sp.]|nr:hypothetical protein [Ketobacter sp.]
MTITPMWYQAAREKLDEKVERGELTLEQWKHELQELEYELLAKMDEYKRGCG